MSSQDDKPRRQTRWALPLLAALAVLLILLGLVLVGLTRWDQIKAYVHRVTAPSVQEAAVATEVWPTLGPTFTPVPSQTPLSRTPMPTPTPTASPTPTPVELPSFSELKPIVEANFLQFKGTTVVKRENQKWWGKDWILLKVVGTIKVGIVLPEETSLGMASNGSTLTLFLPHAQVTSVDTQESESEILGSGRNWLFSEYPALDQEARQAADQALRSAAQSETSILNAAESLAEGWLSDFCHRLGWNTVYFVFTGGVP